MKCAFIFILQQFWRHFILLKVLGSSHPFYLREIFNSMKKKVERNRTKTKTPLPSAKPITIKSLQTRLGVTSLMHWCHNSELMWCSIKWALHRLPCCDCSNQCLWVCRKQLLAWVNSEQAVLIPTVPVVPLAAFFASPSQPFSTISAPVPPSTNQTDSPRRIRLQMCHPTPSFPPS